MYMYVCMYFPFHVGHFDKRRRPLPTPLSNTYCLRKVQRQLSELLCSPHTQRRSNSTIVDNTQRSAAAAAMLQVPNRRGNEEDQLVFNGLSMHHCLHDMLACVYVRMYLFIVVAALMLRWNFNAATTLLQV